MKLTLNGIVSRDEDVAIYQAFGYPAFGPGALRQALADTPEGEELVIEVNSPGGSVWAGDELYSLLMGACRTTVCEVQSLAASAASYFIQGADQVIISPVGQLMLHLPSSCAEGNREDMKAEIRCLDAITESILNAYELRTGGKCTRAKLRGLMEKESWLPAQDCVALGLADRIAGDEDGILTAAGEGAGVNPGAIMNGSGLPDITALRAKYAADKAAAEEEARNHAAEAAADYKVRAWRNKGRLALELARYRA